MLQQRQWHTQQEDSKLIKELLMQQQATTNRLIETVVGSGRHWERSTH